MANDVRFLVASKCSLRARIRSRHNAEFDSHIFLYARKLGYGVVLSEVVLRSPVLPGPEAPLPNRCDSRQRSYH